MTDDLKITLPSHVVGSGNLERLVRTARGYADAAASENTLKAYKADWMHFGRWCRTLRANKRETIDWLKFTLEGAGERTHGYAFTDTTFAGCWI